MGASPGSPPTLRVLSTTGASAHRLRSAAPFGLRRMGNAIFTNQQSQTFQSIVGCSRIAALMRCYPMHSCSFDLRTALTCPDPNGRLSPIRFSPRQAVPKAFQTSLKQAAFRRLLELLKQKVDQARGVVGCSIVWLQPLAKHTIADLQRNRFFFSRTAASDKPICMIF